MLNNGRGGRLFRLIGLLGRWEVLLTWGKVFRGPGANSFCLIFFLFL